MKFHWKFIFRVQEHSVEKIIEIRNGGNRLFRERGHQPHCHFFLAASHLKIRSTLPGTPWIANLLDDQWHRRVFSVTSLLPILNFKDFGFEEILSCVQTFRTSWNSYPIFVSQIKLMGVFFVVRMTQITETFESWSLPKIMRGFLVLGTWWYQPKMGLWENHLKAFLIGKKRKAYYRWL